MSKPMGFYLNSASTDKGLDQRERERDLTASENVP